MNWTNPEIPERYRAIYARRNRSRRAAVRAHCLMCCGWQYVEVENCTATGCPLYRWRLINPSKSVQTGAQATQAPEVV